MNDEDFPRPGQNGRQQPPPHPGPFPGVPNNIPGIPPQFLMLFQILEQAMQGMIASSGGFGAAVDVNSFDENGQPCRDSVTPVQAIVNNTNVMCELGNEMRRLRKAITKNTEVSEAMLAAMAQVEEEEQPQPRRRNGR